MKKALAAQVALTLLVLGIAVQADVFDMGPGLTSLETVFFVGDAGNAADTTGYGSVGYDYNIGKYEVTAGQYTDFLNNKAKTDPYGLYNTNMDTAMADSPTGCDIKRTGTNGNFVYTVASDWANRPVNYVSYWDACRFVNWLCNGQGNGDTESGTYTIPDGYHSPDGRAIQRNSTWKWAVTSENEWYKAAYYDPSRMGGAGYWLFPTRSNSLPANQVLSVDPGNSANYFINNYSVGSPYYRTNVGEFENSGSAYGTFDQGGNVWEWNEGIPGEAYRGLRGGSCFDHPDYWLQAANHYYEDPSYESDFIGFRLSSIPAPNTISAKVTLKQYDGVDSTVPITIELLQGNTVKRSETMFLNISNRFVISGVVSSVYDVRIKAPHWLSTRRANVNVNTDVDLGTMALTNGDCDGDNEVTSTDLSILGLALGSVPGDSNWDVAADLDGDEEITSTDLSILGLSLGMIGD